MTNLENASAGKVAGMVRLGTSGTVTAVIVLLLLLLSLLVAFVLWREHHDALSRAEAQAGSAAHVASAHVRWLVEANTQVLQRVDDALGADTSTFFNDSVGSIEALLGSLPDTTSLWVFDAEGDLMLTTEPAAPRINVGDRDYFKALENGEEWHIGRMLLERATQTKVFNISRRLERDGAFAGAAVASVPAALMSEFWATMDLGPDSSIGLIKDDGWLVARHPIPEQSINLSGHVLFTDHLAVAAEGVYRSPSSPADGVGRIVGYRRIPGLPLITVVGISEDAALARFWQRMRVTALVGIPLIVVLLALSAWTARLLRRDEHTRKELSAILARNRTLMREIHHRVKNNLQVVSGLVQMQPGSAEAKAEMARRIAAMATVHEQLYQTEDLDGIEIGSYIRQLVDGLVKSYGATAEIRYDLATLHADNDVALPLALIVSEVVSNAFKHAFADGRPGEIVITLRPEGAGRAILRIEDNGVGFDPSAARKGLGTRLLKAFSQQIGGEHRFEGDSGTIFLLRFPLQQVLERNVENLREAEALPAA